MAAESDQNRNRAHAYTSFLQASPRLSYVPDVRVSFNLPDAVVKLPAPEPLPQAPPPFSWLTLLTPLATMTITLVTRMSTMGQAGMLMMVVMVLASCIHPLANIMSNKAKRKAYHEACRNRKNSYNQALNEVQQSLSSLAEGQYRKLLSVYPSAEDVLKIALASGNDRRLWYRRLGIDRDFLSLRVGTYQGQASFSVSPPQYSQMSDPLLKPALELCERFSTINGLPFLIPFSGIGSLGVACQEEKFLFDTVYRILLDLLVHHSPDDAHLFLISDKHIKETAWDWVKWVPHTGNLPPVSAIPRIAFQKKDIATLVSWLAEEYERRESFDQSKMSESGDLPFIFIVLDDQGSVRQMVELNRIIRYGHQVRMCVLLIGDINLPQIRARLDVDPSGSFRLIETWEGGNKVTGKVDSINRDYVKLVPRTMASLETMGGKVVTPLPESLPLSQSVENMEFSTLAIEANWSKDYVDSDLLHFPIGVHVTPDGLGSLQINLLPAERGGFDAYHTILIGTTGSGKSEFMKSVVLGAAYKYSPELLNFFFMDFKGGAAFDVFKGMPHVTGVVTNLQPQLVDRGLEAVRNEIARRQARFGQARVRDIWAYNQANPNEKIPHLWLLLDEFAKGLTDFPDLQGVLDLLVRQGRSLGMYLMLANQDFTSAVDKLLSNVGWRIVLKVARRDELAHLLEESRNPTMRPGHGYLRTLNGDILEFQSGYAGVPVPGEKKATSGFKIFTLGPEGRPGITPIYNYNPEKAVPLMPVLSPVSEQDALVKLINQTTHSMDLAAAHPIYLDPIKSELSLFDFIKTTPHYRTFTTQGWTEPSNPKQFLRICVGLVDRREAGIQEPLQIDFRSKDGHLWIVGAPGSGVELSLTSIVAALTHAHTPPEVQFYIIECGSGKLAQLSKYPHIGAVVRPTESERMERLLGFLETELMQRRSNPTSTDEDTITGDRPSLFLLVNNFSVLRNEHMDYVERISNLILGGNLGLHMILASNLVRDVPTKISNNIARRIVLNLSSKDELVNLFGRSFVPLSVESPGRGYWVDGEPAECQIAKPELQLQDEKYESWLSVAARMRDNWQGPLPIKIETLPDKFLFDELHTALASQRMEKQVLYAGFDYDTCLPLAFPLETLPAEWIVLGEGRSGKSNTLISAAECFSRQAPETWQIKAFALRPSPLRKINHLPGDVQLNSQLGEVVSGLTDVVDILQRPEPLKKNLLLLIDDLGAVFDSGNQEPDKLLNQIGLLVKNRPAGEVFIFMAGMLTEFRMKASSNALVRAISQNKTGVCLSLDMANWSWLGVSPQAARPYQKLACPPGRCFFVVRGKAYYLQTPYMEAFHS